MFTTTYERYAKLSKAPLHEIDEGGDISADQPEINTALPRQSPFNHALETELISCHHKYHVNAETLKHYADVFSRKKKEKTVKARANRLPLPWPPTFYILFVCKYTVQLLFVPALDLRVCVVFSLKWVWYLYLVLFIDITCHWNRTCIRFAVMSGLRLVSLCFGKLSLYQKSDFNKKRARYSIHHKVPPSWM